MAKNKIRSIYSPRLPIHPDLGDISMTEQQFKQEVDINNILDHYRKTGYLPPSSRDPIYGDVSQITSFQDALHHVEDSYALFETVPSKIRRMFNNDPGEYLAYVSNPDNHEEAYSLGILSRPQADSSERTEGSERLANDLPAMEDLNRSILLDTEPAT